MDFTLKRYDTVEEIVSSSWNITKDDISKYEINGETEDRKEVRLSLQSYIDAIKEQEIWGYVSDKDNVIYFWIGKNATPELIIEFFGHELEHKIAPRKRSFVDEEKKAIIVKTLIEI